MIDHMQKDGRNSSAFSTISELMILKPRFLDSVLISSPLLNTRSISKTSTHKRPSIISIIRLTAPDDKIILNISWCNVTILSFDESGGYSMITLRHTITVTHRND